jgi:hypothetical protein
MPTHQKEGSILSNAGNCAQICRGINRLTIKDKKKICFMNIAFFELA